MAKLHNVKSWLDYTGNDHHCAVCQTPLHNPNALKTCVGPHMVPCWRFHYSLQKRLQPHRCQYCTQADELHELRHRKIATLVKDLNKCTGHDNSPQSIALCQAKSTSLNVLTRHLRSLSKPNTSTPNENTAAGKQTRRDRKEQKRLGKALTRTDHVTTEEVRRIWLVCHPEHDENSTFDKHAALIFHQQLEDLTDGFQDLSDLPVPDFRITAEHIILALGMGGNPNNTDAIRTCELKDLIFEDLRQFHLERVRIAGRRRAFLYWAGRSCMKAVLDFFDDRDWKTGAQIDREAVADARARAETCAPSAEGGTVRSNLNGRIDDHPLLDKAGRCYALHVRRGFKGYMAQPVDGENYGYDLSSGMEGDQQHEEGEDEEKEEEEERHRHNESSETDDVNESATPDLDADSEVACGTPNRDHFPSSGQNESAASVTKAPEVTPLFRSLLGAGVLETFDKIWKELGSIWKSIAKSYKPGEHKRLLQKADDLQRRLLQFALNVERMQLELVSNAVNWRELIDRMNTGLEGSVKKELADYQERFVSRGTMHSWSTHGDNTLLFYMTASPKSLDALCNRYFARDMSLGRAFTELKTSMPSFIIGLVKAPDRKLEDLIVDACTRVPNAKNLTDAAQQLFCGVWTRRCPAHAANGGHPEDSPYPILSTSSIDRKTCRGPCNHNGQPCYCEFWPYKRVEAVLPDFKSCPCCKQDQEPPSQWVYVCVAMYRIAMGPMPNEHAANLTGHPTFEIRFQNGRSLVVDASLAVTCDRDVYAKTSMKIYDDFNHWGPFTPSAIKHDLATSTFNVGPIRIDIPVFVPLEIYDWLADHDGKGNVALPTTLSPYWHAFMQAEGADEKFKLWVGHGLEVAAHIIRTTYNIGAKAEAVFLDTLAKMDWSAAMPCACLGMHNCRCPALPACAFCGFTWLNEELHECSMKECRGMNHFHLGCLLERDRRLVKRPQVAACTVETVLAWEKSDYQGWKMYCPTCLKRLRELSAKL